MPELPEVQTVVDDLKKELVGFEITDFNSSWKKNVGCGFSVFKKNIIGKRIVDVKRVAKFIVLVLDQGYVILHLRMTGQLLILDKASSLKDISGSKRKHVRHFWFLKKNKRVMGLFFHDVRKFATIDFAYELENYKSFKSLGLEPFSDEFSFDNFRKILKTSRSVRSVLLDQRKILGIGNIYISEILFEAKVYPGNRSDKLTQLEMKEIYVQIVKVLERAIEMRGTTFSDYRDSKGEKGSFQKILKVYNRKGKQCKRRSCTGIVDKETLEQRSSFWCPVCQKR